MPRAAIRERAMRQESGYPGWKTPRAWRTRCRAAGKILVWTTLLLLLPGPPLLAHPMKVGFADITIHPKVLEMFLSMNLFELDLLLSLDRDLNAVVEPAELEHKTPEILEYLRSKIQVFHGSEALPMEAEPFRIGRSADGKPTFEARLTFRSSRPFGDRFTIRCEPLTDLGPDHQTIAKISRGGRIEQVVIVTAFTLAHSVTLSLAALDLVTLPSRLVESGIAFSVAYVALENLFFTRFDRRWLVSFFFGFIHGFGFANVLREMALPHSGLISSLFFFNVGVEVGQVLLVVIVLPFLWFLQKSQFHHTVVRAASAAIFTVGVLWFYQRAL